jgi:hypothetical protein
LKRNDVVAKAEMIDHIHPIALQLKYITKKQALNTGF